MARGGDTRRAARLRRHRRLRKRVAGSAERPRLAVFRSARHIYAQVIDDRAGRTLAAASDLEGPLRSGEGTKTERARAVGALVARRARVHSLPVILCRMKVYSFLKV